MSTNGTAGSAAALSGTSLSSFVTSLAANAAIAATEIAIFCLIRGRIKRIYEPRTFIGPESKRAEPLPHDPLRWIRPLILTPPTDVIAKSGLDAYFFLRYLRMLVYLFGGGMLFVWPILLPINATGGNNTGQAPAGAEVKGLDILAFSNVSRYHTKRLWAHLIVAWVFIIGTLFFIQHELAAFIRIRQAYLTTPQHRLRASATTILVSTIPEEYLDENALKKLFSCYPDGVRKVWLNRDYSKLLDKVKDRDNIARKLEGAETDLLKTARKLREKRLKQAQKAAKKAGEEREIDEIELVAKDNMEEDEGLAARYVPHNKRPTHRLPVRFLPALPLVGKKVDTVHWCKTELARLNPEIEEDQASPERFPRMNSAFIQFHSQLAAHLAVQAVAHHVPLHMAPRYIEVAPEDVIWENMQLKWWERYIRIGVCAAAVGAMIVFWAIPTAFIGSLSNIAYLSKEIPWLGFLANIQPQWILGIITGLLPSVLLLVLNSVLPILLRFIARQMGPPTKTQAEFLVQHMYFAFSVVQIFLVVSISSSITSVVASIINNPSSAATILAQNLPKAANFFFSYLLLQGLTGAAGTLLQVVGLILFYVFGFLFDNTPRKKWKRFFHLNTIGWGTTFPVFTTLAVIGLTYSIIAPLVMIFVLVSFALFYFAYLYNFVYVYRFEIDTGGLAYPRALYHTFTGLYLLEIIMIGLFFLARDADGIVACTPQAILMIILLFGTAIFHVLLTTAYDPLTQYLPVTLEESVMEQKELHEQAVELTSLRPFPSLTSSQARRRRKAKKEASASEKDDAKAAREREVEMVGKVDHAPEEESSERQKTDLFVDTEVARQEGVIDSPDTLGDAKLEDSEQRDSSKTKTVSFDDAAKSAPISPAPTSHATHSAAALDPAGLAAPSSPSDAKTTTTTNTHSSYTLGFGDQSNGVHLSPSERSALLDRAFTHAALRAREPIVWIPKDELGIAGDEIERTRREYEGLVKIEDQGAWIGGDGKVRWEGKPPDWDERELVEI
ncbi:hypothetical protein G7K_6680-t1 [Saitoella complicata NRRL Y-17804]|uniref:DUF221-domain-containing protein n=2 Tax=Saitoella complicata (strain BCRC 22490 / CBS 7301 / JCM 7358 / NBRC 10748 / NRRL Y-17804) TaxID=698492 RepID=A0A0E9NRV3_SAICN|nr:hypothetical protein G7K_6680-t1 [Saitoella complicata NRRL Y-17804]